MQVAEYEEVQFLGLNPIYDTDFIIESSWFSVY